MRLAEYKKTETRNAILSALYAKSEAKLEARCTEIARQNHQLEMAPLLPIIAQLPPALVAHAKAYKVKVRFKNAPADTSFIVDEHWFCYFEHATPTWVEPEKANYGVHENIPSGKLMEPLYGVTAVLCRELHEIRSEKAIMTAFLKDTLTKFSGIRQLQAAWPDALHRFLPTLDTNPKKKSTPRLNGKKVMPVEFPDSLKTRLTINLLEG